MSSTSAAAPPTFRSSASRPSAPAPSTATSDILATAGVHVGGTDFDRLLSLARSCRSSATRPRPPTANGPCPPAPYVDLATWHRINRLYTPETPARTAPHRARGPRPRARRQDDLDRRPPRGPPARRCGRGRQDRSHRRRGHPSRLRRRRGRPHPAISRAELSHAIAGAIDQIEDTLRDVVAIAGLTAARIDTLILTGGSTQIPAIMQRLRANFPERTVRRDRRLRQRRPWPRARRRAQVRLIRRRKGRTFGPALRHTTGSAGFRSDPSPPPGSASVDVSPSAP